MTRVFYPECRIEIGAWGGHDALVCEDAEAWVEEERILVCYFDDDGIVVLEGSSDRSGGWTLAARSRPRQATLAPAEDRTGSYAGRFEEQGESVVWTLCLGEPAGD